VGHAVSTSKAGEAAGTKRIVVGVDGSPAAGEALDWAVNEAALRGAILEVTSVWEDPYRYWGEAALTEGKDEVAVGVVRSRLAGSARGTRAVALGDAVRGSNR